MEYLIPYYLRPTHFNTLTRYEKFDQYLYLPYLSRQLKRLTRMRSESNERIYVWGTFSQIYHLDRTTRLRQLSASFYWSLEQPVS